jgi:hypothetical protein
MVGLEGTHTARTSTAPEHLCNDWARLKETLQRGEKVAFIFSKTYLHVWNGDSPRDADFCQCHTTRWGDSPPRVNVTPT